MAALLAAVMMTMGEAPVMADAAEEYTVTASKAVLYSNSKTVVYEKPDLGSNIVTAINAGLPVDVTGITSNGWFQISLKGTYYIPGYGLEERDTKQSNIKTYSDDEIKAMTKGTFGFYTNSQLRAFTREEVRDMDDNEYIKYLDSFLIGNAMADYCILQDSGVTLKTEYDKKAASDAAIAAVSMKDYLANYRNEYLDDSMWGPVRTEEDLKVTLNRAIRYQIKDFNTVYKNTLIGDDEKKMEKVLSSLVKEISLEQGVTFTYQKEYGTYQNLKERKVSGWMIEFTMK